MRGFLSKYVLSVALGVGLVYLAFRGEDFSGFGQRLKALDLWLTLLYTLSFAVAHYIRIVRWGVLVRALGPIKWSDIVSTGAVGYMCISIFPLRLGELVRPYLVRGRGGVSGSGAMATVVVERVFDGLLFVALFFVFISLLPPSGNPAVAAVKLSGYVAGAVFLVAQLVLIAAYVARAKTVAFLSAVGMRFHAGLTRRAVRMLDAFLDGLKVLPDKRRLFWFFALTFVYWALLGYGMKLMATAANIPDLSVSGAFALLAVVVVGIMVPAGPGFTGTFELAIKAGFALVVVAPSSLENVAVYTIALHVIQLGVQVAFGVFYLMTGKVNLKQVVAASDEAMA